MQLVELKNGEAYNGRMEACDTWMNMHLHEVICTAKDGEKFWRMKEVYIRGNTIKYVRVPDDTLGKALEDSKQRRAGASLAANKPAHTATELIFCCLFSAVLTIGVQIMFCCNHQYLWNRGLTARASSHNVVFLIIVE